MTFEHQLEVEAPRARVWDFLMDVPSVARCLPGLQEIVAEDGDRYLATVKLKMGPISLSLRSEVALVEKDEAAGRAALSVSSFDKGVGGGAKARMEMQLVELSAVKTSITIRTDAQVMGRLGTFGQGIIKKKADQIVEETARNIAAALEQQSVG